MFQFWVNSWKLAHGGVVVYLGLVEFFLHGVQGSERGIGFGLLFRCGSGMRRLRIDEQRQRQNSATTEKHSPTRRGIEDTGVLVQCGTSLD